MFPLNSFPFENNNLINSSSQQQSLLLHPPPPSFSFLHHFPPPSFEDNNNEIFFPPHQQQQLNLLLHHHQQQQSQQAVVVAEAEAAVGMEVLMRKKTERQIPTKGTRNKRICKRDRHSKIKTAKGLRDRRMRLSLEVAKRFFGLQDILGFDKASKTVEWLLNQSKDEIKQLAIDKNYNSNNNNCSDGTSGLKSASSTSECEGISSLDEVALSQELQERDQEPPTLPVTKRRTRNARKSAILLDPSIARESREKARERARERTKQKQKMKMKGRKLLPDQADDENNRTNNHNGNNLTQFGSWNPFETGEKVNNPNLEVNMAEAAEEEPSSRKANEDDDSLAVNMIFNSLNTSSSTFLQDHHHHQFVEFQPMAKFWEAYNNPMI